MNDCPAALDIYGFIKYNDRRTVNIMDDNMFIYQQGVETRWFTAENPHGEKSKGGLSNNGRKGSPCVNIGDGERRVIAEISGRRGVIRRIWMALPDNDKYETVEGLWICVYWDGALEPAVEMPVGAFFMHTVGRSVAFENCAFSSSEGRTYICMIPMPFLDGALIALENRSGKKIENVFYEADVTLDDALEGDVLYFHASRNAGSTKLFEDFELLSEIRGKGRYIGTFLTVTPNPKMPEWWGEGEVKGYIDGESTPTLCGTGSEDYFGGSWGIAEFQGRYHGCLTNSPQFVSMYRFHVPDPVYFSSSFRLTIQSIGLMWEHMPELFRKAGTDRVYKAGTERLIDYKTDLPCLYEREGDILSATCYYYLDKK